MNHLNLLLHVIGLLLVAGSTQVVLAADLLTGKVVSVADGDTLTLLADGTTQIRVRLHGIDAPERGQPFNRRAKDELSSLVFGKVVTVESLGEDRYDRTIGRVRVGGIEVNQHLVEQGMAWHFKRYDNSEGLSQAETTARKAKRGLWQDPSPLPPWEWRKLDKDERQRRREASPLGTQ